MHIGCCFQLAECLYIVEDMLMRVDRYRDELGLSYADDGDHDQHCLGRKLWSVSPSLRAHSRKRDMPQHEAYSTQCHRSSAHQSTGLV